jgi:HK97 gp10 family phage protein
MLAFTLTGMPDLRRRLAATPAVTRARLEPVIRRAAEAVATDARHAVPVVTGTLRRGIRVGGSGLAWWTGVTGPATAYAHFVEWGTSRQAARPFMRGAALRTEARLPGDVRAVALALPEEVRRR